MNLQLVYEKEKKFLWTGLFIAPRYQKWKQTCEINYLQGHPTRI